MWTWKNFYKLVLRQRPVNPMANWLGSDFLFKHGWHNNVDNVNMEELLQAGVETTPSQPNGKLIRFWWMCSNRKRINIATAHINQHKSIILLRIKDIDRHFKSWTSKISQHKWVHQAGNRESWRPEITGKTMHGILLRIKHIDRSFISWTS